MSIVSVVIPTYNLATHVKDAIESVLRQTYRDFELIVVDDGSTDNTEFVVTSYGDKVIYVKQSNRGVSAARNRGIKISRSKYVAFLDADDLWAPEKLEEQVPFLEQDPDVGLVYSDASVVHEGRNIAASYLESRPAGSGYVFDQIIQSFIILPSSAIVRRSCFDEVGLFDETLVVVQDLDLWLAICYRWKVALVPKPLVVKRDRPGSLSSDPLLVAAENVRVYEKALRILPNMPKPRRRLVQRELARSYWSLGYECFSRMQLKQARKSLASSLRYDWRNLKTVPYLIASCLPIPLVRMTRAFKQAIF